jgi:hypothetical protein
MINYKTSIVLAAAMMGLITAAGAQSYRPRSHHRLAVGRSSSERPPLTVNKRSFLDPGPVVPVGSMSNYVGIITVFGQTPDQNFLRSAFGNEVLPGPFDVPGRPSPVLEFATPPYPY